MLKKEEHAKKSNANVVVFFEWKETRMQSYSSIE